MSLLPDQNSRRLGLIPDAFYLGFISLSIQIIYARLAVSFSGGNEVYLSLFFLFWLIFTGIGAFVIKKANPLLLYIILGMIIIIAPAIFYMAPQLFGLLPGQIVPPHVYVVALAIAVLPECFLNGALFSSIAARVPGINKSGHTYWSEALGSLTGGIAVTIFYISGGRDYSYLLFLSVLCLLFIQFKKPALKIGAFAFSLLVLIAGIGEYMERPLLQFHYQPYSYEASVSGRLVRYDSVREQEITTLYSGGVKAADFPDYITSQELFYWPYLAKPDIQDIALIGAEKNWVDKVIPNSVRRSYIYPDKSWRELIDEKYLPSPANSIVQDPIAFLKSNNKKYDLIIINLGQLLSLYDKRLETEYFLELCCKNVKPGGLLSVSVDSYQGIWRDDLRYRLRGIYRILLDKFENVNVIPGDRLTFLAGRDIDYDMAHIIQVYRQLNIDSPYFNEALIKSRLNSFSMKQTMAQIDSTITEPGRYEIGYGLSYYFSKFGIDLDLKKVFNPLYVLFLYILISLLATLMVLFKRGKIGFVLAIVFFGMASFSLEIVSMYRIQLIGGYLYIALGIVVGLFMFGMAIGSFLGDYFIKIANLPKTLLKARVLALLGFAVLAGLFMLTPDSEFILLIIIALSGSAGGFGFAINAANFDKTPGLPYGLDLSGGMLGTIIGLSLLFNSISQTSVMAAICCAGLILMATNKVIFK
jgi:hypothetical protein